MAKFKLGGLTIDATAYGSQGNAILGIRDSGKTYTATEIAEKLFEAGIPFIAFDPTGVWRWLRVPGKGRGYPIVVAGGKGSDLPLTVSGAVEIVRAAMKNGVSLVLDLTDPSLSKANWRSIVKSCMRVLLQENAPHGLRHIFIEEAAEFVPQRILDGDVYAEVEKLARIGGNSRLGYTLINQRSQEVNKAVLELCENLFLHRQKGKNAIQSLDHWLDVAGVNQKELIKSLPRLPSGQCWAWMGDHEAPQLVHVPPKNSFHPDRRTMHGATGKRARKAVNVGNFVKDMRAALVSIEAELKANDVGELRKEIATLKGERTKLQQEVATLAGKATTAKPDKDAIAAAEKRGFEQKQKQLTAAAERDARAKVLAALEGIRAVFAPIGQALDVAIRDAKAFRPDLSKAVAFVPTAQPSAAAPQRPAAAPRLAPQQRPPRAAGNGDGRGDQALPPGERAVLIAACQYEGVDRDQLSVLTGYKRSTRDAYIQRLRERAFVEVTGSTIAPTDAGRDALGADYVPLPTGAELQDYWRQRLPEGERKILESLIAAYPDFVPRETLDEVTGYKRSSRDAYIQRLKSRRLVETARDGVAAADLLFQ